VAERRLTKATINVTSTANNDEHRGEEEVCDATHSKHKSSFVFPV
jgi:hypothetical protein